MSDFNASGDNVNITATSGSVFCSPNLKCPTFEEGGTILNDSTSGSYPSTYTFLLACKSTQFASGRLKIYINDISNTIKESIILDLNHLKYDNSDDKSVAFTPVSMVTNKTTPFIKKIGFTYHTASSQNIIAMEGDFTTYYSPVYAEIYSEVFNDVNLGSSPLPTFIGDCPYGITSGRVIKFAPVEGLLKREKQTNTAYTSGTIATLDFPTGIVNNLLIDVNSGNDTFTCEEHCIWSINYNIFVSPSSVGGLESWIEVSSRSGKRYANIFRESAPAGTHALNGFTQLKLAPGDEIKIKCWSNSAYTIYGTGPNHISSIIITRQYY